MTSPLKAAARNPILWLLLCVPAVFAAEKLAPDAHTLLFVLSVLAIVLGYQSLRRFWLADHRLRWHYTVFIAVVWVLLLVGIAIDIAGLT